MALRVTYTPPKVSAIAVVHAAGEVAVRAGAHIILEASLPLVPVDQGDLKASGKVSSEGLGAAVSYDGISRDGYDYGTRQHEDLTLHHPHGGEGKFLEKPMHTEAPAVHAEMAAVLRKTFGF